MQLKINIKPTKMYCKGYGFDMYSPVSSTKQELLSKIKGNTFWKTYSSNYSSGAALIGINREVIRVYNLEKRRKKVQIITDKKLLKKGQKRVVVTPGYWVAYVYDIPTALLKMAGLKVEQGERTFKFVATK